VSFDLKHPDFIFSSLDILKIEVKYFSFVASSVLILLTSFLRILVLPKITPVFTSVIFF